MRRELQCRRVMLFPVHFGALLSRRNGSLSPGAEVGMPMIELLTAQVGAISDPNIASRRALAPTVPLDVGTCVMSSTRRSHKVAIQSAACPWVHVSKAGEPTEEGDRASACLLGSWVPSIQNKKQKARGMSCSPRSPCKSRCELLWQITDFLAALV